MHDAERERVPPEGIEDQLDKEIHACKSLIADLPTGVHKLLLSVHPSDVGDEGEFHYVIPGSNAASFAGGPSEEARRFINQKASPEHLRTNRNAILLVVPSREGLIAARNAIQDVLGWQNVEVRLKGLERRDP